MERKPQHAVVHQKRTSIFSEILTSFAVVPREKLCYNVRN